MSYSIDAPQLLGPLMKGGASVEVTNNWVHHLILRYGSKELTIMPDETSNEFVIRDYIETVDETSRTTGETRFLLGKLFSYCENLAQLSQKPVRCSRKSYSEKLIALFESEFPDLAKRAINKTTEYDPSRERVYHCYDIVFSPYTDRT